MCCLCFCFASACFVDVVLCFLARCLFCRYLVLSLVMSFVFVFDVCFCCRVFALVCFVVSPFVLLLLFSVCAFDASVFVFSVLSFNVSLMRVCFVYFCCCSCFAGGRTTKTAHR